MKYSLGNKFLNRKKALNEESFRGHKIERGAWLNLIYKEFNGGIWVK